MDIYPKEIIIKQYNLPIMLIIVTFFNNGKIFSYSMIT